LRKDNRKRDNKRGKIERENLYRERDKVRGGINRESDNIERDNRQE
jgi:hypothetical protein